MLNYEDVGQNLTLDDFSELESSLGYEFPESFKAFFLSHNGGYPVDENDKGNSLMLSGFDKIKYGNITAEEIYQRIVTYCPAATGMFPFASDWAGNSFLLSLNKNSYDQVYIWEHEENIIIKINYSFQELVDELEKSMG